MARLNADYVAELEPNEDALLTIKHKGESNRGKITSAKIHRTHFTVYTKTVQYGTWQGIPAVLFVFEADFGFRNEKRDRITSASLTFEFEETEHQRDKFCKPRLRNYENDPVIEFWGPAFVTGEIKHEKHKRHWDLEFAVKSRTGADIGPKVSRGWADEVDRDHRMWLRGERTGNDEHRDNENIVKWRIQENSAQKSGILANFTGLVVASMPRDPPYPIKLTVSVNYFIDVTVNPTRLLPKRDDPILLDRVTPKGPQYGHGKDFADAGFPWEGILKFPSEYENKLFSAKTPDQSSSYLYLFFACTVAIAAVLLYSTY